MKKKEMTAEEAEKLARRTFGMWREAVSTEPTDAQPPLPLVIPGPGGKARSSRKR